jgi:ribose 5-phosphate isomerase A
VSPDAALAAVAARALTLVHDGARVGLGTGHAAEAFIAALGTRVGQGLRVAGVPTSEATTEAARRAGIPLIDLDLDPLDLTVDGADEVSPELDLVKGFGGALVRERIVAAASRRQVILVGRDKLVRALGEGGRLPLELVPFARPPALRRLAGLGLRPVVRSAADGTPLRSENGNLLVDCAPPAPLDAGAARALDAALRAIPGVVDTGLFLGTAERILVGEADGSVTERRRR